METAEVLLASGDTRSGLSVARSLGRQGIRFVVAAGALLDYLSGFRPSIHPEAFRLKDPMPEFADHWLAIRNWAARRRSSEQREP